MSVRWNRYRVRCLGCGWVGRRSARDCECYDEWRMFCRPGTPGPGCPSWVTWPCPRRCLSPLPDGTPREHLSTTRDSMVVVTHEPRFSPATKAYGWAPTIHAKRRPSQKHRAPHQPHV